MRNNLYEQRRFALILLLFVALLGCSAGSDDLGAGARRAPFSSRIDQVVHGARPFVATSDGFTLDRATQPALAAILPARGDQAIRFRLHGFEIAVREVGVSGAGKLEGAAVVYDRAGGTSFWGMSDRGYEEWLLLDAGAVIAQKPVASWQIEGATARERDGAIELLDAGGAVRITVTAPEAYTASGRQVGARLAGVGSRIELFVDAAGEAVFVDPAWASLALMKVARFRHTATLLRNGKVLVTGGESTAGGPPLASTELFDPLTNTWSLAASMSASRYQHTATLLPNGSVLVAGGITGIGVATASAEIYDPVTNTWATAASMTTARYLHTATALADGRVLAVGGFIGATAEVYDPIANTWTVTGPLNNARVDHTATLLQNGKVLVAGGTPSSSTAELYDPATNVWSPAASMSIGRRFFTATLLPDGEVYAAGGTTPAYPYTLASAELYDPATDTWSAALGLGAARDTHTATLLPGGEVLLAGGEDANGTSLASAEIHVETPAPSTAFTASMTTAFYRQTATLLADGRVLVAGGGVGTQNAELFYPDLTVTIGPKKPSGAGSQSNYPVLDDLNRDGKLDLLVTAHGYINSMLGNGDGTFQPATPYTAHTSPCRPVVGDFNGDQKDDFAVANADSRDVTVRLGYGNGHFKSAVNYAVGDSPCALRKGDFNADGKLDLATASQGSDAVTVLLGNGDGTFRAAVSYPVGARPNDLAVGDWNGDGKQDLATPNWSAQNLSVLFGNGDGTFGAAANIAMAFRPAAVAAGDFNGDQRLDLVTSSLDLDRVAVLLGNGDGTFQAPQVALGAASSLDVADVNHDQKLDVLTVGDEPVVLLGNGDGTLQPAAHYGPPRRGQPESLALGDVDGDHTPDLVVANYVFGYHVLHGNTDGTFQSPVSHPFGVGAIATATGDFNGDGRADIVVANEGSENVSVFLSGASGALSAPVNYAAGSVHLSAVAAADLNVDGKLDLVVADIYGVYPAGGSLSVLLGNGDGTFQSSVSTHYLGSPSPTAVAVGDMNGDHTPDLVVTSITGGVAVLRGVGDGTFQDGPQYATSSRPLSVALGDFNGDGKLDVVTANYLGNNANVFLGNGDGTLRRKVNYAAPGEIHGHSVAVGDLNGDHRPDFAVANYGSGNVSVFLGRGDGTFDPGVNYATGSSPRSVVAVDFNGDGLLDLGVTNSSSNTVSVLAGLGNGALRPAASFAIGKGTRGLAAGDIDGDGKPDLVATAYTSNDVTVLFNRSP